MRIDQENQFDKSVVSNGIAVTLPQGYERGIWNQEKQALFLIGSHGRKTLSTCIPDKDLRLDESSLNECRNCSAYVHEDCAEERCRFCGTEQRQTSVLKEDVDNSTL